MKDRSGNSVFVLLILLAMSSSRLFAQDNIIFLDFNSGETGFEDNWQAGPTPAGPSFRDFMDYYRIDKLRGGYLIADHCSYYSDMPCDYLRMQINQIIKPYYENGFWDPDNNNWVRRLLWSEEEGWHGYSPHDWKYSLELQEGALMAAMSAQIFELDPYLARELEYIHWGIDDEGRIGGMEFDEAQYEYGLVLSALGLGAVHFINRVGVPEKTAEQAYSDLYKVFKFIVINESFAGLNENLTVVLRGVVHAYNAFSHYSDTALMETAGNLARRFSRIIVSNQKPGGYFDFSSPDLQVQQQLKACIALMLMHAHCESGEEYTEAVRENLAWVIGDRWDHMEKDMGGLVWRDNDLETFYECHQMWFLIAARYHEMNSEADYGYHKAEAMGFLTDDNFAGVDMYVDNWTKYGAFFSYRAISRDGSIQKEDFHQFKGAYEIGASLWGMALNYDMYSEGHARLITQTPMDSARTECDWSGALFLNHELHSGSYSVAWDMMFHSLDEGGAMAGLYSDYAGNYIIQLDSDEGLVYRGIDGASRLLYPKEGLEPGTWYKVQMRHEYANSVEVVLSSGDEILYSAFLEDMFPAGSAVFGILQWKSLPGRKNNIYVDNFLWQDISEELPDARICLAWPNPFNSRLNIVLNLDRQTPCDLALYDVAGRMVRNLFSGPRGPGKYVFSWDGITERGDLVTSGVYFLRITTGEGSFSKKVILLK